jgi:hypothetical protein
MQTSRRKRSESGDNGLPESEVEGRIYVKREDLDAFIESHKKA